MRISIRAAAVAASLTLAPILVLSGCGGGSDDPATEGPRTQAVERLTGFGLTEEQATCVVDEIGGEAVIEAEDLAALAAGGAYQDAAATCIEDE